MAAKTVDQAAKAQKWIAPASGGYSGIRDPKKDATKPPTNTPSSASIPSSNQSPKDPK